MKCKNKDNILDIYQTICGKINVRCHHMAIITYKKRIISIGFNYIKIPYERFGVNLPCSLSIHAEVSAINNIPKKYRRREYLMSMFVIRIDNNLELSNSHPCKQCCRIISKYGFKSVYYSF